MIIPLPAARMGAPPAIATPAPLSLRAEIARLIDQHGPLRLAATLMVALAARGVRPGRALAHDLSPRLHRDIGLPPAPPRDDYWRHL